MNKEDLMDYTQEVMVLAAKQVLGHYTQEESNERLLPIFNRFLAKNLPWWKRILN